jgi:hypothetical protein
VTFSGRSIGIDTDNEHSIKIANVMASTGRTKATVSCKSWLQDEENRDSKKLVEEDRHNSTCFGKISPFPGRPNVDCIDKRIVFE